MAVPWAAIIGGVSAIISGASAISSSKKAKGAKPPLEDPRATARSAEATTRLKSIRAGNDPSTQVGLREAKQLGAQTQDNVVKLSGGNSSMALTALRMAQRGTGTNVNKVISGLSGRIMQQEQFRNQIASNIEQRRMELQLLDSARHSANAAANKKQAMSSLSGLGGMFGGGSFGGGKSSGADLGSIGGKVGGTAGNMGTIGGAAAGSAGGTQPPTTATTPILDSQSSNKSQFWDPDFNPQ